MMRAAVLTSTMRRHCFVANRLASRLNVVHVWQERKSFEPLRYAAGAAEEAVIARHFEARDASEAAFFAADDRVTAPSTCLPPGGCNDAAVVDAIRQVRPDILLVFGTGLLQEGLIAAFPDRIFNIHLGLSPYYRGAGTNFWPLVNGEPEYCGATIHYLDAGVDTGPIIAHVRPPIDAGDGPHDIGNRTIVAAADALADAVELRARGRVRGVPQTGDGRLYRRADFSAAAVERLYANFESGMIPTYLRDRATRDARLSLVTMSLAGEHVS
jgi:folate-dependent phosphoribosylglycinamide formyltransferase PurN